MTGDLATLRRFAPPDQRAAIDQTMRLLGISEGAAIALSLCREALREWCPPDESVKVVAALVGLESRRKAQR